MRHGEIRRDTDKDRDRFSHSHKKSFSFGQKRDSAVRFQGFPVGLHQRIVWITRRQSAFESQTKIELFLSAEKVQTGFRPFLASKLPSKFDIIVVWYIYTRADGKVRLNRTKIGRGRTSTIFSCFLFFYTVRGKFRPSDISWNIHISKRGDRRGFFIETKGLKIRTRKFPHCGLFKKRNTKD